MDMLTLYSRSQFVTKILTSATGEQFRVVFHVALVNGEVKAKIVSADRLFDDTSQAAIPCLPVFSAKSPATFTYTPPTNPLVSPFTSLFFFNSQPIRGPSR